jgi:hypothetical protein
VFGKITKIAVDTATLHADQSAGTHKVGMDFQQEVRTLILKGLNDPNGQIPADD